METMIHGGGEILEKYVGEDK